MTFIHGYIFHSVYIRMFTYIPMYRIHIVHTYVGTHPSLQLGRNIICMHVSLYILVLIPAYTCTLTYVQPCLYISSLSVEVLITEAVFI